MSLFPNLCCLPEEHKATKSVPADSTTPKEGKHREDYEKFQSDLLRNCAKMKNHLKETFDPFSTEKTNICNLNNGLPLKQYEMLERDMRRLKSLGQEQFDTYMNDRLVACTVTLSEEQRED